MTSETKRTINGLASLILGSSFVLSSCAHNNKFTDKENSVQSVQTSALIERNFSEEIPGSQSVKFYEAVKAPYTLVHVRQKHDGGILPEKYLRDLHTSIYQTLAYFADKKQISNIYAEGVFPENAREKNEGVDLFREIYRTLSKEEQQRFRDSFLEDASSATVLSFERERGAIKIRAAEDAETYLKALETEHSSNDYNRLVREDREDVLLNMLARENPLTNQPHMFVTVYGGGHDWTNNVQNWNKAHPDKRFSLIVITPKLYNGYIEK